LEALLTLAKKISYDAHSGQFRRDGSPYFMHPFRVSNKCNNIDAKVIALLHDVLEDTNETVETLLSKGIPSELVSVVQILSKSKYESYNEYLKEIKNHDLALEVKLLDMLDNLCDNPSKKQILKYSKAISFLLS
jgi:(p)ppGpp synthase/HD superfamily hydrolase